MSTFFGHTVFSIYFDQIDVFEQILNQLRDLHGFEDSKFLGDDTESQFKRRLFRILNLPVENLALTHRTKAEQDSPFRAFTRRLGNCFSKPALDGSVGYKSLMQKSIHFHHTQFRDCLIDIAIYCQETGIGNFVDSIDDMRILFSTMSNSVINLFESGFNTTIYTKRVKHTDWRQPSIGIFGQDYITNEVFNSKSSMLTEQKANRKINKRQRRNYQCKMMKRQVRLSMVKIDWIFRDSPTQESRGYNDLIDALAKSPNESVFGTELIDTLMNSFWREY